ncbi:general odorant-binding protein 56h-like [Stomoxys calcitrans]|uniref:general odorant-binding protein 56h-like n=1 Tax=Stomoxys calcitrans TaxID=35570 RepID=UPI0027E31ACC|nr:general odorant-binding protein 56h-like [Stomoxys calcitrans]
MKNCEIFVIVFVVFSLNISKAFLLDELKVAASICREEFPDVKGDIYELFDGRMDANSDDDEFKCFVKCMVERQGSLVNGTIDITALLKDAKTGPLPNDYPPELVKMVEKCSLEKGANDCETAFKMVICVCNK